MPVFRNPVAKQCARWILLATSPAPLPMLHPVRDDMAAAADEIDRLTNALVALRDNANIEAWLQEWARGVLERDAEGCMKQDKHVDEMRRAAEIIAAETHIGICEGGFPIAADRCEFCESKWNDKCGRRHAAPTPS